MLQAVFHSSPEAASPGTLRDGFRALGACLVVACQEQFTWAARKAKLDGKLELKAMVASASLAELETLARTPPEDFFDKLRKAADQLQLEKYQLADLDILPLFLHLEAGDGGTGLDKLACWTRTPTDFQKDLEAAACQYRKQREWPYASLAGPAFSLQSLEIF